MIATEVFLIDIFYPTEKISSSYRLVHGFMYDLVLPFSQMPFLYVLSSLCVLIFYFVNVVNCNVLVCLCSYCRLSSVSSYKEEFFLTVLKGGVFKIQVPALLVNTYVVEGGRPRERQPIPTSSFHSNILHL